VNINAESLVRQLIEAGVRLKKFEGKLYLEAPSQMVDGWLHTQAREKLDVVILMMSLLPGMIEEPLSSLHRPVGRVARQAPMSFAQQRLWFLDQIEVGSSAYNIHSLLKLEGDLDRELLERSFTALIVRHEILRTRFEVIDGVPSQAIEEPAPFRTTFLDLSFLNDHEKTEEISRIDELEKQSKFDLSTASLLRTTLVRVSQRVHVLSITIPHIVADGWSLGIFVKETCEFYAAQRTGMVSEPAPPSIQYADYAQRQRQRLVDSSLQRELEYWLHQLADIPTEAVLPRDFPRPSVPTFKGDEISLVLPQELSNGILALSGRESVTPFMFMLTAFQALLSRYGDVHDVVVGCPISGRIEKDLEPLIGCFINTLVLRTNFSGNPTFRQLLKQVKETTLNAYAHQELPFERLVSELNPTRNASRQPLFQVMFTWANYPEETIDVPGLRGKAMASKVRSAMFDLALHARMTPQGLIGSLIFATDLFKRSTIEHMRDHFVNLICGVVAEMDIPYSKLPMLSATERFQILVQWNQTAVEFPRNKCIHELFAEQVNRTPNAIAITDQSGSVSFSELNIRANRLARFLIDRGVSPEKRVGICVDRSIDMIVCVFAVLKAGGAYVPIEPELPIERATSLLQNSSANILITKDSTNNVFSGTDIEVIDIGRENNRIANYLTDNPRVGTKSDNLAYVIYTSGSTGAPKGVAVTHRSLANLFVGEAEALGILAGTVVLQVSSNSFDAAVWEWLSLLRGAHLVICPREVLLSGEELHKFIDTYHVEVLTVRPGILPELSKRHMPSLRTLMVGGEGWSSNQLSSTLEGTILLNGYGPTETTVTATISKPLRDFHIPPIGRPITNTKVYVLDNHMEPVPVGVEGELYIGGEGVSRGYLGNPSLTAEYFVANPFGTGERIYRTGDRVKFLTTGDLQFIGRRDDQAKIRGYRIEPGEIEATLMKYDAIARALVLTSERGTEKDKFLVAYFMTTKGKACTVEELREYLRGQLPEFMIPSAFVRLDDFPTTTAGKVDRSQLPRPGLSAFSDLTVDPPKGQTELALASMWQELLHVDFPGRHHNFFELGGHSLLVTRLLLRIRQSFHVDLPVAVVFNRCTIAELAEEITTIQFAQYDARDVQKHKLDIDLLSDTEVEQQLHVGVDREGT
jgi:amino acid adenylation domain-containing protein